MWLNQLYRRWTGRTRTNRRVRRATARRRTRLTLEALEARTLLSAPPVTSLAVNASQGQFGGSGPISGNTGNTLDPQFNAGGQVGGFSAGLGLQAGLNMQGNFGVQFGYTVDPGNVNASYQSVALSQNYQEPTQYGQEVDFTPQNTNVSYTGGSFSTTSPSVSAYANLVADLSGSISAAAEFAGHKTSGSVNFNTGNVNQQLFQISLANAGNNQSGLTVKVLGQDATGLLNQYLSTGISAAVDLDGAYIEGKLNGSANPLHLHEELEGGVGVVPEGVEAESEGLGIDFGAYMGSMDQYAPAIALNSSSLQNGGVLTDSQDSEIADLQLPAGPIAAVLLAAPTAGLSSILSAADTFTLSVGPASVSFTPVNFQIGPELYLNQTGTITPTNSLTYKFYTDSSESKSMLVDVTKDGVDLGKVSSVSFLPGVDNVGIQFNGTRITVQPVWNFGLNFTNQVDLDADLVGFLTVGELTASVSGLGSKTLGPIYFQPYTWFNRTLATLYSGTSTIYSKTDSLTPFTIGDTFTPSLAVTTPQDTGTMGSLRFAVNSANAQGANSSTPQIIQLGAGTYYLNSASLGSLNVTGGNVIIEGAGIGQTIINASGLGSRPFNVQRGAHLTLEGVTLENGSSSSISFIGGGILNYGNLTLKNSELSNNSAFAEGGGIYNEPNANLTIDNSTLDGNSAGASGGGITNLGHAEIDTSTLANNSSLFSGGGIDNSGQLKVSNSTLNGNKAQIGGGIANEEKGDLILTNSTLYGNSAFSQGGGLWLESNAVANLVNDTLTQNHSDDTGYHSGSGLLGGGIYVAAVTSGGGPGLDNTIVADNYNGTSSSTTADDIQGSVNPDSGNNLIGAGGSGGLTNGNGHNLVGVTDPGLGTLVGYAGNPATVPLLAGSPAIDAGNNGLAAQNNLTTDERGYARIVNKTVDIGADEYQYDLDLSGAAWRGPTPGTIQYRYQLRNNGPDSVNADVTVPLPAGTVFESLGLTQGWTETDPGQGNSGTVTFTDNRAFNAGGLANFTITVQLQNTTAGASLTNTATVGPTAWDTDAQNNSMTLTIANEQEGQTFNSVTLFHFTDANSNETAGDFTASVDWGDNTGNHSNDGRGKVFVVADPNGGFDVVGTHAYAEEGEYAPVVQVNGLDRTSYDSRFQAGSGAPLFVVSDAQLSAGALTPPPNAVINQPITNAVLFHFTDADPNAAASDYTAKVIWGDGSSNSTNDSSGTVSVVADANGGFDVVGSHTYSQIVNPGTFTVQVSDAGGSTTSASDNNFQVLNADQPLTAGALNVPSVTTEGQSISNQVLFHFSDADPDAQASDYLAIVSWGDGSYSQSNDGSGNVQVVAAANGGFNVVGSHTYAEGSASFAVQVIDQGDSRSQSQPDNGGQSTSAASAAPLTIRDPAVVVKSGPMYAAGVNSPSTVQTLATFIDPGGPEADPNAYLATIEWGDGASTTTNLSFIEDFNSQGDLVAGQNNPGIVLGSDGKTFSVNLAHQYAQAGNYNISITINHDGQLSQTTTTALVTAPAPPPAPPPSAPPPAPPPAPFQPPTLQVPPLLAFFDSLLGATETINANRTETLTASFFGIPLLVSTFDSSGKLESVLLFGMNVTALFELL